MDHCLYEFEAIINIYYLTIQLSSFAGPTPPNPHPLPHPARPPPFASPPLLKSLSLGHIVQFRLLSLSMSLLGSSLPK